MELKNYNKKSEKVKEWRKHGIDLPTMVYNKIPPQAREIEEAVLGACLLDVGSLDIAQELLKAESFYVDSHQRIFKSFLYLSDKQMPVDILTVVESLKKADELDSVGGPYAITKLTNNVVSGANIETHCRIIIQKAIQRDLIRICGETISESYNDAADAFDCLDDHETKLLTVTQGFTKSDVKTSEAVAHAALERIEHLIKHTEELSGVPSGYPYINKLTNGWQSTDLIILAARPSVGKTAFALNLAINAASDPIKPTGVVFFSLEMSAGQLANRAFSTISHIHLEKIARGRLFEDDHERVLHAALKFANMPIFIDDTAALSIIEFRSKARRLVSKNSIGLIIIDYLQLMKGNGGNREQEIAGISRSLKALAKELKVPIMALSQLSRAVETRKEKNGEPQLSDLRESGAIEQDADMVMFLYRPDYQERADQGDQSVKGDAFVKFAKHRNGSLEVIPMKTELSIQKWFDIKQHEDYTGIRATPAPPKEDPFPAQASKIATPSKVLNNKMFIDIIDEDEEDLPF
jgi:replicative DNA helicase